MSKNLSASVMGLLFSVISCWSSADELFLSLDNFCAEAQQSIAQTSLAVTNTSHTDFQGFVKSKPSVKPLISHQFVEYLETDGEQPAMPMIISCKMKTASLIQESYGLTTAGEEKSCRDINRIIVSRVAAISSNQTLRYSLSNIVFDEDEQAYMGPQWLKPWPYVTAYEQAGRLHFRGKAMHIPFAWYIPMPARFKGTHYCHLPAPQYVAALLAGDLIAPTLAQ